MFKCFIFNTVDHISDGRRWFNHICITFIKCSSFKFDPHLCTSWKLLSRFCSHIIDFVIFCFCCHIHLDALISFSLLQERNITSEFYKLLSDYNVSVLYGLLYNIKAILSIYSCLEFIKMDDCHDLFPVCPPFLITYKRLLSVDVK